MADLRAFTITVVIEADADAIGSTLDHEPHDVLQSEVLAALERQRDYWPDRWEGSIVSVATTGAERIPGPRARGIDF